MEKIVKKKNTNKTLRGRYSCELIHVESTICNLARYSVENIKPKKAFWSLLILSLVRQRANLP